MLRDLVSRTNVYINSRGKDLEVGVVVRVASWVGKMLRVFGLGEGETSEIGWGQERHAGEESVDVRTPPTAVLSLERQHTEHRFDCSARRFSYRTFARYPRSVTECEAWPLRKGRRP